MGVRRDDAWNYNNGSRGGINGYRGGSNDVSRACNNGFQRGQRRLVSAGFLNVNGWNTDKTNNYCLQAACVGKLNHDIIGIAEAHLTKTNNIRLDGYSWFGKNKTVVICKYKEWFRWGQFLDK